MKHDKVWNCVSAMWHNTVVSHGWIFVYYCTILELFFKKWIKIICGVSEFFSNLPPTQTMRKRLLVTLFLIILAMTPCHPNNIKGKPRHLQYRPWYRSWSENIWHPMVHGRSMRVQRHRQNGKLKPRVTNGRTNQPGQVLEMLTHLIHQTREFKIFISLRLSPTKRMNFLKSGVKSKAIWRISDDESVLVWAGFP